MKKKIYLISSRLLFALSLLMFASCSDDNNQAENNQSQVTKGRFDNTPFVWDEIYAQRPADNIYIGDLNVSLVKDNGSRTRSSHSIESNISSSDNLFIISPVEVYVGAAYTKSSFPYKFDKEISKERNSIDIVFDFKDPFIDKITRETGSVGYKMSLKSAINSNEYQKQLAGNKPDPEYYITQYSSPSDLKKAFSANTSLGSAFSAKVSGNSKNRYIRSRTLAKIVSVNFSVYMDTPPANKGFFKDTTINKKDKFSDADLPVYVRSLTYGKVVYIAIESEYPYSEVKQALDAAIKYKFESANMNKDQQVTKIFSKSSTTIFAISDNSSQSFFMNGLADLSSFFSANNTTITYGYPIYMEGRYVYDNSSYLQANNSSCSF